MAQQVYVFTQCLCFKFFYFKKVYINFFHVSFVFIINHTLLINGCQKLQQKFQFEKKIDFKLLYLWDRFLTS